MALSFLWAIPLMLSSFCGSLSSTSMVLSPNLATMALAISGPTPLNHTTTQVCEDTSLICRNNLLTH